MTIGQRRSAVTDDSVRRRLPAACAQRVCGPLPYGYTSLPSPRKGDHLDTTCLSTSSLACPASWRAPEMPTATAASWSWTRPNGETSYFTSRRSADPPPFPGLTTKPLCAACEQAAQARVDQVSSGPPPLMTSTRGRRADQVATQHQFCPHPCWVSCPESVKYYAKPLPSVSYGLRELCALVTFTVWLTRHMCPTRWSEGFSIPSIYG